MKEFPKSFSLSNKINKALLNGEPIVALESTVISHGLPYPDNFALAKKMKAEITQVGSVPATIAVIDGRIRIGLDETQLKKLAKSEGLRKIGVRDIGTALQQNATGGTTVSSTSFIAEKVGIKIFATGGIGGVHRYPHNDISADLLQLSKTPIVIVCSGVKSILDLPATLEYLETIGVPVIGYKTDIFPAFYSSDSGLPVSATANSPEEVFEIANAHWSIGLNSALLLTVPPPAEFALPIEDMDNIISQALIEAEAQHIIGQNVTPFLLNKVSELSGGKSLEANLNLLTNNAKIAGEIAPLFHSPTKSLQA